MLLALRRMLRTTSVLYEYHVKSMREIPGPTGLPLLGTSLDYLRLKDKAHTLFFDRVKRYGNIYKENLFAGMPTMVNICDPADIEVLFRADGKYPDRKELPFFYEVRDALGIPYGLLLSLNEDWYRQRQPMSQFMMVPRKVGEYHEGFNEIAKDLVVAIKALRTPDNDLLSNLPSLLFKWSFESVSFFTLGKRLGALNIGNVPARCQEIIDATQILFDSAQKAIFAPPLHKIYPTKLWKSLLSSQDKIYKIAMSFIEEKMEEVKVIQKQISDDNIPDKMDFLTYMLLSGKLKIEEITSNAVDLLFAGIDTTAYTLVWCLYNIATNKDAQNTLRNEIKEVVGDSKVITPDHIEKMKFLRNCVKETLRLYPLVPFNTRSLQQGVIFSGYKVPAGVQVLVPMLVIGRMKEYFPTEPDKFIPDRWNREGEYPKNRFVYLPFGFGPRMCIGRRIAEIELHISIAHIVKNFLIEFPESKAMDFTLKSVLVPERQFNLVFNDIN